MPAVRHGRVTQIRPVASNTHDVSALAKSSNQVEGACAVSPQAQRDAAQRAERAEQIREWREGLAAAHTEYLEWSAKQKATGPKPASANFTPRPNIVGAVWFQNLRPYMSTSVRAYYRTGDDIECDDDDAHTLGNEISRIQQDWRDNGLI